MLGETAVEEIDQRNIQAVQPNHGRIAGIAVIVKRPGGREDQIARMHADALAIHSGVSALAFDDEAQRGSHVAVAVW